MADMQSGYVKIFRRLLENPLYQNSSAIHLWITLLLHANHRPQTVLLQNGQRVEVAAGQLLTSRSKLAKITSLHEAKVERLLTCLKTAHQIEQQSFSKFRLITITNWNLYQASEQQSEQQANSKRTASEQQANTNNNDKNDKNDKKEKKTPLAASDKIAFDSSNFKFINLNGKLAILKDKYPAVDVPSEIRKMEGWLMANPKNIKSNYERFITNWLSKAQDKSRPGEVKRSWEE